MKVRFSNNSMCDAFSGKETAFAIFIAVLAVVMFSVYASHLPIWDDAYISFRYSDNLANGKGMVYNPGEKVEGYTNFLWVVLIALTNLFRIPVWASSRILGCASILGLLYALKHYRKKTSDCPVSLLHCPVSFSV